MLGYGALKPKVLIADDSPLVLRMIEKMLAGAGYDVVTARDGLEAIEKAVLEDGRLIILDVMMPRMNGYQACRLLKSDPATRELPVIILTSRDQAGDRFWGIETGADYYVTKDSDTHRILDLVNNVLAAAGDRPRPRPAEGQASNVDILSRVNDLLDRKLYEATILSEIGRVARNLVHFDETFTSVMGLVARVVGFSVGAMAFVEGDDAEVVLMIHGQPTPEVVEEAKARIQEALTRERKAAPSRVHARVFAPAAETGGPAEKTLGGFAAFPVVTGDRLVGLLAIGGRAVARLTPDTETFLRQVANQSYIVMDNSRLFERVRDLAFRDGVTGLFNHRHLMEVLKTELERTRRYQQGFSLLMVDIDHFKKVNDEHGHPAGDAVLREVAGVLQECMRAVDVVGRYGGEEFVAVLPGTSYEEAVQTAERIRVRVGSHTFRPEGRELHVTISVGVASCPQGGACSADALVHEADKAMYAAKAGGRNRTA